MTPALWARVLRAGSLATYDEPALAAGDWPAFLRAVLDRMAAEADQIAKETR